MIPGLGRSPREENGNICLENPHRQRRLAGYSLWSCKELDMIEWLSTAQHTNEKLQLLPVTFLSWTLKNREYLFISLFSGCPTFHQVYKEGRFMRYRTIFFVWHGGKNNWNWIIWEKSQNYSLFKWYICFLFACLFQHIHILISTFGLLHMVFIYFFNWSIVDLQCCVKYQVVLQSDSLYIYAFFSDYFPL